MLISEKMQAKLNEQINNEQYSAHLYLSMATALDSMGLKIFAEFYYRQAKEETEHAMKILKYVVDAGGSVELKGIADPKTKFKDVAEIVQGGLDHEIKITNLIKEIAALAEEEKDYLTRSFISWFLDEQVEEVSTAQDLVDIVRLTPSGMVLAMESRVARMLGG